MAGSSRNAVYVALGANLVIACVKFVGFFFTRSSSMLAEAVHSVADSGNQALLLFGGRASQKRESEEHPFGYGRERYFWAFVVSIVLFALGSLFALYEGIQKIFEPHALESPAWAVGILGMGVVLEGFSLSMAVRAANPLRGNLGWAAFVRRSKDPEIAVVLLEDLGALIGLLLAMVGVTLAWFVDPIWDGVGTVAIGVLLGLISIVLMREMKSLLIGESASLSNRQAIRSALASTPGVEAVLHVRTMHLGPDDILVTAEIELSEDLTGGEVVRTLGEAEDRVRARVPEARIIYLEPDLAKPPAG